MKVKMLEFTLDADSGEIIFRSDKDMEFYLFTGGGFLLHNKKAAVKIFRSFWIVAALITRDERSKLYDLLPNLDDKNCLTRKDRPGKPMTAQHIADYLGSSISRCYRFLKRMEELGIIRKREKMYYVNPLYIMADNRLDPELYRIFADLLESHIPDWAKERYKEMDG